MTMNFVTFYDIQRMYLKVRTNSLKFLDYQFPYYRIEEVNSVKVITKKSILIKDIVVSNGFITTKNSTHTTSNLIEFLSSLSHYTEEFYHFYFFRKDFEDFISCIYYNTELKEFDMQDGQYHELCKLDTHYVDIVGSKVVKICQNLQLLYPNLNELITVRNEMLTKIPFSERAFNVGGHNNIVIGEK